MIVKQCSFVFVRPFEHRGSFTQMHVKSCRFSIPPHPPPPPHTHTHRYMNAYSGLLHIDFRDRKKKKHF